VLRYISENSFAGKLFKSPKMAVSDQYAISEECHVIRLNYSRLAFIGSVALWVASVTLARAKYYELFQGLGLIGSPALLYTPLLWIALGLAALSILRSVEKNESLLVFELIFIGIALQFSLSLFQENPRVYDSYIHYGTAKALMETQHTNPAEFGYQSWPGAFLWASVVTTVLNIPGGIFLYYFPLYALILLTVGLYVVARRFSGSKTTASAAVAFAAATVMVFLAENNSLQTHFSPQAVGLILIILFAYTIFSPANRLTRSSGSTFSYVLMGVVIFTSLTISHPPSALLALLVLLISSFLRLWRFEGAPSLVLAAACGVIFAAWQVYEVYQFAPYVVAVAGALVSLVSGYLQQARYLRVGIPKDPVLSNLTILRHMFFFSLGILGLYRVFKRRDKILTVILSYGIGTAMLFAFLLSLLQGFLWDRILLYGAFPVALSASYLIQKSRHKVKHVLVAFTLIFLLINAYVLYADEPEKIVPTSEQVAVQFLLDRVRSRSFTAYADAPLSFDDPSYARRNISTFNIDESKLSAFTHPGTDICSVAVSGRLRMLIGDMPFQKLLEENNVHMNRYYSSNYDVFYLVVGACV
jgi:hypothetical protein